jgi:hypothetical protein
MPLGPGAADTQGIWNFGESDTETLFSDLLNVGQASTSAALALDRVRLATIETRLTDAVPIVSANMGTSNISSSSFVTLPTIPTTVSITTTRARRVRVRLVAVVAVAGGVLDVGVAVSGATTAAANEVISGTGAGVLITSGVTTGATLNVEKIVTLNVGVNTFTVHARLAGAGGTKTVTNPVVTIEGVN